MQIKKKPYETWDEKMEKWKQINIEWSQTVDFHTW